MPAVLEPVQSLGQVICSLNLCPNENQLREWLRADGVSFDDDLLSAALTRLETAMVPGYNVRLVRGTELHSASSAVAVGLFFGIAGEVAGFQALLAGPTKGTISLVDGALMALGATALLPRFAELLVPKQADAARRFVNSMLPVLIGSVGLVSSTVRLPLTYRVPLYVLIGVSVLSVLFTAMAATRNVEASRAAAPRVEEEVGTEKTGMSNVPDGGAAVQEPENHHPQADDHTAASTRPGWWLLASMAAAAVASLALDRRRRGRRG
jgi:hypothetical protein